MFVPGVVLLLLAPGFEAAFAGTTLLAPGLAGMQVARLCLLAEIADDDAARTGLRRTGAYFGLNGMLSKAAFAVQGLLVATVLPLTGYVPGAGQPAGALAGIRFLFAGVPLLCCVLGFVVLGFAALRVHRLRPAEEVV
nr:MFS transporter [Thermoactinospora rubra]